MKIKFFQPDGGYFRYAATVGTVTIFTTTKREMRRKIRLILKAATDMVDLEKEFPNH